LPTDTQTDADKNITSLLFLALVDLLSNLYRYE